MIIQYYISNGEEINYSTQTDYLTLQDINEIASLYVKKKPETLPDTIFINVRFYQPFFLNSMNYIQPQSSPNMYISTCAGLLLIKILPMMQDGKMLLIGKQEDWDRYDIDSVFEKTVLKDCEKE